MYFDSRHFLIPFTNWTLMLTTASIYLSYSAAKDPVHFSRSAKSETAIKKQAWHHLLYSLSILFNLVVVVVYWSMLHEKAVEKWKDTPIYGPGRVRHLYTVHTFPAISCLINSAVTNCKMSRGLWKLLMTIFVVYAVI